MTILGIGGILGDAAAAVLKDGQLVGAVEQRKLARVQRPGRLPEQAIAACLEMAGVKPAAVDCVAIARPITLGPDSNVLHIEVRDRFPNSRTVLVDHHTAHAASAYYPSACEEATVLTLDRSGDFRCGARWRASGLQLNLDRELYFPDSLGDVYRRVVELLGFGAADPHKLPWLAAGGDDRFTGVFLDIFGAREGGWPRVDRSYFDSDRLGHGGFSGKFYDRIGLEDGAPVPEHLRAAIAAGVQRALEQTVMAMAGEGGNLCLAGGVAMNAVLISRLECSGRWNRVFVQPAAGNPGTAIGAVYYAWHNVYQRSEPVAMGNLCLGPEYDAEAIKRVLENCKLRFRYLLTGEELTETAIAEISDNKIVAWMQGRMEFGPRALGNRSILASPLDPYSTENLNTYIKHREPFRKFAASVPAELASQYFEVGENARFLATVGRVRPEHRKTFEAAILGEGMARVHTVTEADNPLYWRLLHAAGRHTGLPVLFNTSFNLFGDPMVCGPRDAVRSFYSSGIDSMFVGHFFLQK